MNKYLGDGILAYWRDEPEIVQEVVSTIGALKQNKRAKARSFDS